MLVTHADEKQLLCTCVSCCIARHASPAPYFFFFKLKFSSLIYMVLNFPAKFDIIMKIWNCLHATFFHTCKSFSLRFGFSHSKYTCYTCMIKLELWVRMFMSLRFHFSGQKVIRFDIFKVHISSILS